MRRACLFALLVCASLLNACSDSSGPGPGPGVGPLTKLAIQSGNTQSALAGTALISPIIIVPQDQAGRTVVNQTATFTVTEGGGSLSSSTGTLNADGTITAPTWTLGKADIPQQMTVDVAGKTIVVTATVQTSYVLAVRFFGAAISATNQTTFSTAAARVRGFIVGAAPPVNMAGAGMDFCTGPGSAPLNEAVNGLLIFASVDTIDGPGKILAQAGPCYFRGASDFRTIIGLMRFDSADVRGLGDRGQLQDVIMHEMLHVVGLGTYWGPDEANLLVGAGAPGAAYTGAGGIAACRAIGGAVTCASNLPVEDCVGIAPSQNCGPGSQDSHWKETTFGRELMTAYFNAGVANPLSAMTIRSFEDIGYVVNTASADTYNLAAISAALWSADEAAPSETFARQWERPLSVAPRPVSAARLKVTTAP